MVHIYVGGRDISCVAVHFVPYTIAISTSTFSSYGSQAITSGTVPNGTFDDIVLEKQHEIYRRAPQYKVSPC